MDTIVYATGFDVPPAVYERIRGHGGHTYADLYRKNPASYLGMSLAGFPNFFNTLGAFGAVGNQSAIFMIEAQVRYIVDALTTMRRNRVSRIEVRDSAQSAFVDEMNRRFPSLDLILIESGGDNLAATFSPELADLTIYVIDVAAGDKIPRKGGPGITRSDLLVINKTDLAPLVGASLEVMDRDARKMRGDRPFVFTNLKTGTGVAEIAAFIVERGGMEHIA